MSHISLFLIEIALALSFSNKTKATILPKLCNNDFKNEFFIKKLKARDQSVISKYSQKNDPVIFGATAVQKHRYVGGSLTEDDRYLIISASTSTSGNKLFIQDLTKLNRQIKSIAVFDQFANTKHLEVVALLK